MDIKGQGTGASAANRVGTTALIIRPQSAPRTLKSALSVMIGPELGPTIRVLFYVALGLFGLFAGLIVGFLGAGVCRIVFRRDRWGLPSISLFERGIISAVSPVYVWVFREPLERDSGLRFSDGLVLLVWLFMSIVYFVTWPLYGKLLLRPQDRRATGPNNRPSVRPDPASTTGMDRIITCRCGTRLLVLEGERRVLCGGFGWYT